MVRHAVDRPRANDDLQRLIIDDTHDTIDLFQGGKIRFRRILERQTHTCHTVRELTNVVFPPDMLEYRMRKNLFFLHLESPL